MIGKSPWTFLRPVLPSCKARQKHAGQKVLKPATNLSIFFLKYAWNVTNISETIEDNELTIFLLYFS